MHIPINKQRAFKLTEPTASGKEVMFIGVLRYYNDVEGRRFMAIYAASTGQFPYNQSMDKGHIEERDDHLEALYPDEEEYVQQELIKAAQAEIQRYTTRDLMNPEKRKIGLRYEFPKEGIK